MKNIFQIVFFVCIGFALHGQNQTVLEKGTVSFVSTQKIYVKFASTKNINIGDTLFINKNGKSVPALVVDNKSSTSAVCTPLLSEKMKVADELMAVTILKEEPKIPEEPTEEPPTVAEGYGGKERVQTPVRHRGKKDKSKQKIKGRISAASYSSISNFKTTNRMRYGLSFRGDNLKNSKFSTDNYLTFKHTLGQWQKVRDNLGNALKVYSLSVKYDFDETSSLTFGRKINPKISSIGAIDGLQYERGLGRSFLLGAIVGSRPDHTDYGLNLNLLQIGAYVSYVSKNPDNFQQSTLGFIEQRNHSNVDRRFIYFQHSGELLKNLNFFSSAELDLYQNINEVAQTKLRLTSLFLSLRYRASKKLRFSASYDNRKNIIYYETYKNFIDRLIENETRQGLRFGVNYRPLKYVSWGVNTSLRFQKSSANVSRNLNSFISVNRIGGINLRTSLRANFLQTNFLTSRIFGIRLSKDIIPRKLNGDFYFRVVDYNYKNSDTTVHQNIAGMSLSLRLLKKLTFYVYYEGTFDNQNPTFHRFNTKIIQRF